jgi:hypothetical protein
VSVVLKSAAIVVFTIVVRTVVVDSRIAMRGMVVAVMNRY